MSGVRWRGPARRGPFLPSPARGAASQGADLRAGGPCSCPSGEVRAVSEGVGSLLGTPSRSSEAQRSARC